jgi:octaprenyl-diphosphate synthase
LATEISNYLVNSGGKRIRPILCILTARALSYEGTELIKLASSIELLHTATLIHDDVVDQSSTRRGKESIQSKWGNAHGVLVGDFVYSKAFQLMADLKNPEIIKVLANSTNIISEGEVLQLALKSKNIITEEDYFEIIGRKTAELFKAASESAAILSGASKELISSAQSFAYSLGIAFQVQDDLLDYLGDEKLTGKKIGKDFEEGKITLPILKTLELVSSHEKDKIMRQINSTNPGDLKAVINCIKKSGALFEVKKVSDLYTDQCLDALSNFPESIYKLELVSIVSELKGRNS